MCVLATNPGTSTVYTYGLRVFHTQGSDIGEAMGTRRHRGEIAGEGGNRFLRQPAAGCGAARVSYDRARRTGGVVAKRGVRGDASFDWVWDRSNRSNSGENDASAFMPLMGWLSVLLLASLGLMRLVGC